MERKSNNSQDTQPSYRDINPQKGRGRDQPGQERTGTDEPTDKISASQCSLPSDSSDKPRKRSSVVTQKATPKKHPESACKTDPDLCVCGIIPVVTEMFTRKTADRYESLKPFQQQVLKQFLIRKFEFPEYFFKDNRLDTYEPFDHETVEYIANCNSPKRADELLKFVVRQFKLYLEKCLKRLKAQSKKQLKKKKKQNVASSEESDSESPESGSIDLTKKTTISDFEACKNRPQLSHLESEFEQFQISKIINLKSFVETIKTLPQIRNKLIEFMQNDMQSPLVTECNRLTQKKTARFFGNICKLIRDKKCTSAESGLTFVKSKFDNNDLKLPSHINDVRLVVYQVCFELECQDS